MVRSNANGNIGFLCNEKRMNVAVTRAKRLCVLIGDSGTVSRNTFLNSLCTYFKENGQVRTAFDYQGNPDVRSGYGVKGQTDKSNNDKVIGDNQEEQKVGKAALNKAERKKLKKAKADNDKNDES